ncbi:MAG: hypothetical protein C0469_16465, partial [Cyanobacteria bacterium DS2.3.42]|nr:hypothetical protein [Cyanobacteria bacterium DS2.3.42]
MKLNRLSVLAALAIVVTGWQSFSPVGLEAVAKGKKGKPKVTKKVAPFPPEFNEAVKLVIYEKKYKDAFDIFDRLDRTGFCRDKTHYYMALCLHNLNQTQQAAQH